MADNLKEMAVGGGGPGGEGGGSGRMARAPFARRWRRTGGQGRRWGRAIGGWDGACQIRGHGIAYVA